ncbi:hypothetical protein Patl1_22070 [Pistacia atlantica]|uniref:Uncharacterized protein n=1 Tax=Pistacia atlantica TaxID=434234 RepID=A0ACC1BM93_9ROSI|nr:hypothetical protein Patl1_22070 [Pistacia atlantica]
MVSMGEFWVTLTSVVTSATVASVMFRTFFPTYFRLYFAKRFKADVMEGSQSVILSVHEREEVLDEFNGVKVWWVLSHKTPPNTQSISIFSGSDEKRYYKLKFHKRHRELITGSYVKHVFDGGKAIAVKNRQRKLFSNIKNKSGGRERKWSHVPFEHPATFDSLAMETKQKEEIKNDLKKFRTGKSTMIAAMANLLNYDVYDLELTTVADNSELRSLLIETTNKSMIVIEDIDCSLDLTGQRKTKKKKAADKGEKNIIKKALKEENESKESKVTLSGLLNFIDGLWSACGGERIIVFTTNFVDKLDPALIRRGRMDKHIEMSYCGFEAFKMLQRILMPKSDKDDAETCLKNLIEALKEAKEEAIKKVEEEARLKA